MNETFDDLYRKRKWDYKKIYDYVSPPIWKIVEEGGGSARKVAESLIAKILELEASNQKQNS